MRPSRGSPDAVERVRHRTRRFFQRAQGPSPAPTHPGWAPSKTGSAPGRLRWTPPGRVQVTDLIWVTATHFTRPLPVQAPALARLLLRPGILRRGQSLRAASSRAARVGAGFPRDARSVLPRLGLPPRIVVPQPSSLHPLLLDATWWRERLRAMDRVPRHLLVFPRPELAPPGRDVAELWLRAHDGIRLRGILGRSPMAHPRPVLRLALLRPGEQGELEWSKIAGGRSDLLFEPPPSRRLEDRVLDVLRICQATRVVTQVHDGPLRLDLPGGDPLPDELRIADRLLTEGWI